MRHAARVPISRTRLLHLKRAAKEEKALPNREEGLLEKAVHETGNLVKEVPEEDHDPSMDVAAMVRTKAGKYQLTAKSESQSPDQRLPGLFGLVNHMAGMNWKATLPTQLSFQRTFSTASGKIGKREIS